jgi:hypothetical protein
MKNKRLFKDIKVKFHENDTLELLDSISYHGVTIKKGFIYNGADVPSGFRVFYPPYRPKHQPAVIFHDYFCSLEEYEVADRWLERILRDTTDYGNIEKGMVLATKCYSRFCRPLVKKVEKLINGYKNR